MLVALSKLLPRFALFSFALQRHLRTKSCPSILNSLRAMDNFKIQMAEVKRQYAKVAGESPIPSQTVSKMWFLLHKGLM